MFGHRARTLPLLMGVICRLVELNLAGTYVHGLELYFLLLRFVGGRVPMLEDHKLALNRGSICLCYRGYVAGSATK